MSSQSLADVFHPSARLLTGQILEAVGRGAYNRLPALLESQRTAAAALLSKEPDGDVSEADKRDIVRGIQEALLLATVKRIHLVELIDASRRRSATVSAYRCEPSYSSGWASTG
jgi:hypothetical protein